MARIDVDDTGAIAFEDFVAFAEGGGVATGRHSRWSGSGSDSESDSDSGRDRKRR